MQLTVFTIFSSRCWGDLLVLEHYRVEFVLEAGEEWQKFFLNLLKILVPFNVYNVISIFKTIF